MLRKYAFISLTAIVCFLILFSFCMNQRKEKMEFVKTPKKWYSENLIHLNKLNDYDQALAYEKSIVVLKNETSILPIGNLKTNISLLSIGGESKFFKEGTELFSNINSIQIPSASLIDEVQLESLKSTDFFIISLHATDKNKIKDSITFDFLEKVPKSLNAIFSASKSEIRSSLQSYPAWSQPIATGLVKLK